MRTNPPSFRKPSLLRSWNHHQAALTFVEVLVVIAVIAVLWGLTLPALSDRPARSERIKCVSNLRQVGLAYRLWSGDNGDHYQMSVPSTNGGSLETIQAGEVLQTYLVMSNELNDPKILWCTKDIKRHAGTDFTGLRIENLSYFVGRDASETSPNMLLSGDRNIVTGTAPAKNFLDLVSNGPADWTGDIHQNCGNIGLADGSVQQISGSALRKQIAQTGMVTNRIVLP